MLLCCIPESIKFDYFDAHRWADAPQPWELVCAHICHQGHPALRGQIQCLENPPYDNI